mmetsp:Transcript_3393/g.7325  ORF Transcript_3393/g.7325 Transcript_3393/m.7325 type:complete len:199 (+) Transcript_3393:172-768(+)
MATTHCRVACAILAFVVASSISGASFGPSTLLVVAGADDPSLPKPRTTKTGTKKQTIPVPSAPQLRYQSTDFVALIHFNMATFAKNGDPGCDATNWNKVAEGATGPTSDPGTFRPKLLNTTQWFDSINALGAKIAVLTAKHGCGFLLWPTNASLPPSSSSSVVVEASPQQQQQQQQNVEPYAYDDPVSLTQQQDMFHR